MLSQFGHIMVSVADSVMVGQLGAVPLASVSLAVSVFTMFMLFGIGVSFGMTPLIAAADGANDKYLVSRYFKNGLVLNTVLGVLLSGLALASVFVFDHLGQEESVLVGAIPFFQIMAVSLLPLMVFQAFRQFAEGLSMTRQAMVVSVVSNLVNIGLNYVLIFGHFGIEPMGVIGAGVATLLSRVMMVFAMGGFVLWYGRLARYRSIWARIGLKWHTVGQILRIGVPTGLQFVFEIGAFSASAIMIGWLGAIPLAAHQIALNLSAATYMTATGISAAASIRVGNQLGRKDYVNLRTAGMTCFYMAASLMACFSVLFVATRTLLPSLYVDDAEVIQLASGLLIIAAFYQISDGIQTVGLGVLRGLGEVKVPTIVTLIAYWGVAIPMGYVLGFVMGWGSSGVWVGLLTGLTLAAVAHVYRFRRLTSQLIIQG
ncbi:MATE family efflux transporter [Reichenbachiella sp. 5M10]|nr:MATE family efflux transporter [Reichenbachiella sp. 5M10]